MFCYCDSLQCSWIYKLMETAEKAENFFTTMIHRDTALLVKEKMLHNSQIFRDTQMIGVTVVTVKVQQLKRIKL